MWKEWKYSSTKWWFENIKYGIYPQNSDLDDLLIVYKQSLLAKWPIDCLTNNIVEGLEVSSIKWPLDNRIGKSNPRNTNLNDLIFDGDERLIARGWLYSINDDIVFRLINGLSVYV